MSSLSPSPTLLPPNHNKVFFTTTASTSNRRNSRSIVKIFAHNSNVTDASTSRRDALIFSTALLSSLPFLSPKVPAKASEEKIEECSLTVTASGLAYCDRVVGTGGSAMKGQLIKAHYTGKLENGKVFDSSYPRGAPLKFRIGVGEVIKGWDQGILGGDGVPPMLSGGKRTLKLPPELAYGVRGAGCKGGSCIIPPDSTLLFEVEFIG